MRNVRIFSLAQLAAQTAVELDENAARHVSQVLRMQPGQALTLFDGTGGEYPATIEIASRSKLRVFVGDYRDTGCESPLDITLWHGLCRGERMDAVIQKATELGVARIRPVLTERSVVKLDERRAAKKQTHWQKIAISACEQSGRNRIPDILTPAPLAAVLPEARGFGCAAILSPDATVSLAAAITGQGNLLLVSGPEGGFTDTEVAAATASGMIAARLGPRVLRTETAPLVALAIAQQVSGDLGG